MQMDPAESEQQPKDDAALANDPLALLIQDRSEDTNPSVHSLS